MSMQKPRTRPPRRWPAAILSAGLLAAPAHAEGPTGPPQPTLPDLDAGQPGQPPPGFAIPRLQRAALLSAALGRQPVAPRLRGQREVQIYAAAAPAVFKLVVYDPAGKELNIGSAVLIREDGQLLTNLHVVGVPGRSVIAAYPKPEDGAPPSAALQARVLRVDPVRDLALVKIAGFTGGPTPLRLATTTPAVGADVHAIGHPSNQQWTFTRGMVSQVRPAYRWGAGQVADVVQHQTPIDAGSSGGPLLNDAGELVGLNTFVHKDRLALNYAVAAAELRAFLDEAPQVLADAAASSGAPDPTEPAALTAAATRWTELDQDGDGKTDLWVGDLSGDRAPDTMYLDDDGDGRVDRAFADLDRDGYFEAQGRDGDQNGRMDAWILDHDFDGTPDSRAVDADEDGHFEAVERLSP